MLNKNHLDNPIRNTTFVIATPVRAKLSCQQESKKRDNIFKLMNDKNQIHFSYAPFNLWFHSIVKIFIVSFYVVVLCLVDKQPLGFIFGITIGIVSVRSIQKTFTNLQRSINNQPAITFTDQYFINHMNNTKIHWKNIDKVEKASASGYYSIKLVLRNRKIYAQQIKEPVDKLYYFLDPKGKSVRIPLYYIKEKNDKIYNIVDDLFLKKKNYY